MDALKDANEQLLAYIRSTGGPVSPEVAAVYAEFVEEWCGKDVDDTLVSSCLNSFLSLMYCCLRVPDRKGGSRSTSEYGFARTESIIPVCC